MTSRENTSAPKKIGKNNPKAEKIKADNEIRMEWNRTVDRAIVSGMSEAEIIELKKTEITDRVKESVEQNGQKPGLFGEIVRAAILLLELLIAKTMQKVMDIAEKIIGNTVDGVKETSRETKNCIHAGDTLAVQSERKKIPFPINPHRKPDMQKNTEHPIIASTEKESIIKQIKAEQNPVPIEAGQTAERPPYPKPSILASKYPRLKEIEGRLKDQNKAIFGREKKRDMMKKELSECTGIFKGGRRKELQQEIDSLDFQISNMKRGFLLLSGNTTLTLYRHFIRNSMWQREKIRITK